MNYIHEYGWEQKRERGTDWMLLKSIRSFRVDFRGVVVYHHRWRRRRRRWLKVGPENDISMHHHNHPSPLPRQVNQNFCVEFGGWEGNGPKPSSSISAQSIREAKCSQPFRFEMGEGSGEKNSYWFWFNKDVNQITDAKSDIRFAGFRTNQPPAVGDGWRWDFG